MSRDVVHVGFDLSFDDSSFSYDDQKIHCATPCLDGSFSMEVENAFVFLTLFRNCGVRVKTVPVDFQRPLNDRSLDIEIPMGTRDMARGWRASAINHRQDTPASDLLRSKIPRVSWCLSNGSDKLT